MPHHHHDPAADVHYWADIHNYDGATSRNHDHDGWHHHHSDDGTVILIHQHDDTGDVHQHNYHGFDYDRDEHIDIHYGPAGHDHDTT